MIVLLHQTLTIKVVKDGFYGHLVTSSFFTLVVHFSGVVTVLISIYGRLPTDVVITVRVEPTAVPTHVVRGVFRVGSRFQVQNSVFARVTGVRRSMADY